MASIPIRFEMALVNKAGAVVGTSNSTSDQKACVTRKHGHRWMTMSIAGIYIKKKLRVGDERNLNIDYIRPSFTLGDEHDDVMTLGYATYPWNYPENPLQDDVVIEPTTIVGGVADKYNEGDTLVHEVG
jgi:hypothetical protein